MPRMRREGASIIKINGSELAGYITDEVCSNVNGIIPDPCHCEYRAITSAPSRFESLSDVLMHTLETPHCGFSQLGRRRQIEGVKGSLVA